MPDDPARALRVVTYNVHGCVGLDGRTDVARIGAILAELDADVIALQEVHSARAGQGGGQVAELAERLGMHAVLGTTMPDRAVGPYGNAILSRLPVLHSGCFDLTVVGCEPRCLMHVELEHGGQRFTVMNTHLGVRLRERHAQLRRCAHLLEHGVALADQPLLVMGDFNSWLPRGDVLGKLRARFGAQPAPRSFPVRRPIFALDRIWTRPASWLRDVAALASPQTRVASDHLPVWARLAAFAELSPATNASSSARTSAGASTR
ncbi:MAG: endonuclease/exonuclease/phosphatase family protein [Deltaproteobacteria bacterium]|nr:endonuclease/exonuclease/phosphatase family protein [Nannocystaceae bacterium]